MLNKPESKLFFKGLRTSCYFAVVLRLLCSARAKFNLQTDCVRLVFESDGTCLDDMDIETLKVVAGQNIVLQVLTPGEEWRNNNAVVMLLALPIACFYLIAL